MRRVGALLLSLGLWACPAPPSVSPPASSDIAPSPAKAAQPLERAPVATSSAVVVYRVQVPQPSTHYLQVQARFPSKGRDALTVMMPVWTPGSYLVREFARHVDRLSAEDESGRELAIHKVRKNRWRVTLDGASQVILRYRVYANEPSVRTNAVDDEFFILNGAAAFLTDVEALDRPHEVQLDLPEGYGEVAADLPVCGPQRRCARDYDHLVDAPIIAGKLRRLPFKVKAVPHELVQLGGPQWPDARSQTDVARLAETIADFWGQVPYSRYLFLNVINEARGGLEHGGSTLMMTGRRQPRTEAGYRRWLGLVSHEFFHTWNGKRLRPQALGPFDYEREVYTRDLWFVEGLTSYYDDLLMRRAGLLTEAQYLEALSGQIKKQQLRTGRAEQPLAAASYDAWIEYYRPDESSENTTISYYTKGAVVGFVLDMAIRRATSARRSLDDVMRLAYARHSGATGYSSQQLSELFEEVGGPSVADLQQRLVQTTQPIDYAQALDWAGLRFKPAPTPKKAATQEDLQKAERKRSWLGLHTENKGGRVRITRVVAGGPAEQAGLQFDDEIVAWNGIRLGSDLKAAVALHAPGDEVELLIARRGEMRSLKLKVGKKDPRTWSLEAQPKASATARARRAAWLTP